MDQHQVLELHHQVLELHHLHHQTGQNFSEFHQLQPRMLELPLVEQVQPPMLVLLQPQCQMQDLPLHPLQLQQQMQMQLLQPPQQLQLDQLLLVHLQLPTFKYNKP